MGLLTVDDVRDLAASGEGTRISLYFPMYPGGPEIGKKNPVRMRNLLRAAQERLEQGGLSKADAESVLQPAHDFLANEEFWLNPASAFAGFLSNGDFHNYRLPLDVDERVVVGSRYFLKPLLPLLVGDGRFWLLALSQKRVRLMEGTMHSIRELDLSSIPQQLQDVVGYDYEQKSLQFHSGFQAGSGGAHAGSGYKSASIFHGQGAGDDDQKAEIEKFLRVVDKALMGIVADTSAPLVVAAAEPVLSMYRDLSKYPALAESGLEGNPDQAEPEELHGDAWEIVEPRFLEERRQARDRYRETVGTGLATDRLQDIVPAAFDGRVDALFVATDTERWGRYDPESREVLLEDEPSADNHDLLDVAAIEALQRSATVYAVPEERVPSDNGTGVAAIFRY